jgi:hypothetical protein
MIKSQDLTMLSDLAERIKLNKQIADFSNNLQVQESANVLSALLVDLYNLMYAYRAQTSHTFEGRLSSGSTSCEVCDLYYLNPIHANVLDFSADYFTTFPVSSSFIRSLSYNYGTRELRITFKHEGKPDSVWSYLNVNLDTFNTLLDADSVGETYNEIIKGIKEFSPAKVVEGNRAPQQFTAVYTYKGGGIRNYVKTFYALDAANAIALGKAITPYAHRFKEVRAGEHKVCACGIVH